MKAFVRIWEERNLEQIGKHLLVAGHLSGECFNCHTIGIDTNARVCPQCKTQFKYKGFRKKINYQDIIKSAAKNPDITLIDFDDYLRRIKFNKAKKLLDLP